MRGATFGKFDGKYLVTFQSTRPVRGATSRPSWTARTSGVSIHAPRAGRDQGAKNIAVLCERFQSTRPVRGATQFDGKGICLHLVSIHAPRAGRDSLMLHLARITKCFNPRAPCGARPRTCDMCGALSSFQSTRPVRGATYRSSTPMTFPMFQSTRPVRGATQNIFSTSESEKFQSTRPVRGATKAAETYITVRVVSIHAPRAGRDAATRMRSRRHRCFNPRAPCGARQALQDDGTMLCDVSIHAPRVRDPGQGVSIHAPRAGRDGRPPLKQSEPDVSIHAPRAGRDGNPRRVCGYQAGFNPRAPCGARHRGCPCCPKSCSFNPRAPCGARRVQGKEAVYPLRFQSTRPVRGATGTFGSRSSCTKEFQSTRPVRGATRRGLLRLS